MLDEKEIGTIDILVILITWPIRLLKGKYNENRIPGISCALKKWQFNLTNKHIDIH
jgi:hypothetical protein